MSKYEPLRAHRRADGRARIEMSFDEVEQVVGKLPASAHEHQAWWANSPSHPEAVAWMGAGYRVDWFSLTARRVRFVRG